MRKLIIFFLITTILNQSCVYDKWKEYVVVKNNTNKRICFLYSNEKTIDDISLFYSEKFWQIKKVLKEHTN